MPGCQKLQMTANPVWHRMLYSCTHMTTVGVKRIKTMTAELCNWSSDIRVTRVTKHHSNTTYSSSLKQLEKSPTFWYFFLGCGGRLLRRRLASGVVMATGRLLAPEQGGELERMVESDSLQAHHLIITTLSLSSATAIVESLRLHSH